MTVAEGKETFVRVLQDLQSQGVWIKGIQVDWFTDVEAKDVPKPQSKIRCVVKLEAEL